MTTTHSSAIFRPKDAAAFLGVALSTVYRWERDLQGFPRRVKLGPRVSGWRLSDLEAWLDKQAATQRMEGAA
ncbi:helix-turn-helix transcriptional regulator [Methylohalobius crimeensis]|uniref:helix-turn-helix transcriptional regulator n=1 Tax=Methylohalobius crimeensis TaxID=244365 RepID=UPI0003B4ADEB|nr:AlpA family phage regulatory protein [Methylohalobius crimeensis]